MIKSEPLKRSLLLWFTQNWCNHLYFMNPEHKKSVVHNVFCSEIECNFCDNCNPLVKLFLPTAEPFLFSAEAKPQKPFHWGSN